MAADEPTTALGAKVILFAVAFFPVPGYVRTMATGAFDFYGDCHNFIVFLCAPVVIISLS
jgi:hypothetical protein